MDRINEVENAELIDLGAVSVETQGGAPSAGEPDGRFPGLGIAED